MDRWIIFAILVPAAVGFLVGRTWIAWTDCIIGVATIAVFAVAVAVDPGTRAGEGGPGLVVLFFGTVLAVAVGGLFLGLAIRRVADRVLGARRRGEPRARR